MFLTSSGNKKAGDVLLDTAISFKARSLYLLIDSLGGQQGKLYTPSVTILVATTGWEKSVVRDCLAELVQHKLACELEDHSDRFYIRPFTSSIVSSVFSDSASGSPKKSGLQSILTSAELDALLN
jgi:hypothetical protein